MTTPLWQFQAYNRAVKIGWDNSHCWAAVDGERLGPFDSTAEAILAALAHCKDRQRVPTGDQANGAEAVTAAGEFRTAVSAMSRRVCATCRWFQDSDQTCRALPPTPDNTPFRGKVLSRRAVWAIVAATDWCGRWKRRKRKNEP